MKSVIGYQFLIDALRLGVPARVRPARIGPTRRLQETVEMIMVPEGVAPTSDDPVEHLLFALKHEGTDLDVMSALFDQMGAQPLIDALNKTPSGGYIRKACHAFENLTGQTLEGASGQGVPVALFDPQQYLVSNEPVRDNKWSVDFNGLGTWDMCPTVRRTQAIEEGLGSTLFERAHELFRNIDPGMIDRALAWAYLNETKSSFAIEREPVTENKAQAFITLLQQAWDNGALSEDRLVELQHVAVVNPLLQDFQYRATQNHLHRGPPGATGVTYVPPLDRDVPKLMDGVLAMANQKNATHPLIQATLASFGFVYVHPFMDGNGRLSRFLIHHVLARSGVLPDKTILPISAAMKRNELEYLHALESFSKPARRFWDVAWIGESDYNFRFKGHPSMYKYWDGTKQAEFMFRMANQSLDKDLVEEVDFLHKFDDVYRQVDAEIDILGKDLATLIRGCHHEGGKVSKNLRKKFQYSVMPTTMDLIEEKVRDVFFSNQVSSDADEAESGVPARPASTEDPTRP